MTRMGLPTPRETLLRDLELEETILITTFNAYRAIGHAYRAHRATWRSYVRQQITLVREARQRLEEEGVPA